MADGGRIQACGPRAALRGKDGVLVTAAVYGTSAVKRNRRTKAEIEDLEQQASDYDSRVTLADAARNAWDARVTDLRGQDQAGHT